MKRKQITVIISIVGIVLLAVWAVVHYLRPKADTYVSYVYNQEMVVYGKITPPTGVSVTDVMVVVNQNVVRARADGSYRLVLTPRTFKIDNKQRFMLPAEFVNVNTLRHYSPVPAKEQPSVYLPESWREGQVAVYSGRSVSSSSYLDLSQRIDVALK